MRQIILILFTIFFATAEMYSQANIQYTTNFNFRTIKRGYTGDWIGSQTDTTTNQGLNYNALRSEGLFSKIFTASYSFQQSFKDSMRAADSASGAFVTITGTQTNITGQKRFSNVANDFFGDTASFTVLLGSGSGITGVLKPSDSTLQRTFSNLSYLKNADSTSQRSFSDLKYAIKSSANTFLLLQTLDSLKVNGTIYGIGLSTDSTTVSTGGFYYRADDGIIRRKY
jgi:hypothetical protein